MKQLGISITLTRRCSPRPCDRPRRARLDKKDAAAGKQLVRLLSIPVENYKSSLTILQLEHYAPLLGFLSYDGRLTVAKQLVESVLRHETIVPEARVRAGICSASGVRVG